MTVMCVLSRFNKTDGRFFVKKKNNDICLILKKFFMLLLPKWSAVTLRFFFIIKYNKT